MKKIVLLFLIISLTACVSNTVTKVVQTNIDTYMVASEGVL
jgi:hypothetical protein